MIWLGPGNDFAKICCCLFVGNGLARVGYCSCKDLASVWEGSCNDLVGICQGCGWVMLLYRFGTDLVGTW